MSDLIERLEKLQFDEGPEIAERMKVCPELSKVDIDAILSALKTVRGIEGPAKGEWIVKISEPLQDARNERENQWLVEIGRKCFYGSTLSLAVDAAVGAREKGVK